MKWEKIVKVLLFVALSIFLSSGIEFTPVEDYDVSAGFGVDLEDTLSSNFKYSVPFSTYVFKGENVYSSSVKTGKAKSQGETRGDRLLKSNKISIVGAQRIVLLGEERVEHGIKDIVNISFANPQINDNSVIAVVKGKTEDIFNHKVEGYSTSAEYVEEMIKSAHSYNFFSRKYSLIKTYIGLESEGMNIVLPYIELKNNELNITGMALFKDDCMVYKLGMDESRIMNILRENNTEGVLTIKEMDKKYINYKSKVKKAVECYKDENNYRFNINLEFNGDILVNTVYKDLDVVTLDKIEVDMGKRIETMCNGFIETMKNIYKVDCLQLGMHAASKYGRDTGVDWNKVVSNSDIKVNVKVNVKKVGRGAYNN